MRNPKYDVLIKDSVGYMSMDDFDNGLFYIYDEEMNCVVYCKIHFDNQISILSYLYPESFDDPGTEYSCNGERTKYFTLCIYNHYDKYRPSKEQDEARQCAEKFFYHLGSYTRLK